MDRSQYMHAMLYGQPGVLVASEYRDIIGLFADEAQESTLHVLEYDGVEAKDLSLFADDASSPTDTVGSGKTMLNTGEGLEWRRRVFVRSSEMGNAFKVNRGLRMVRIGQSHSWSCLQVTRSVFKKLLEDADISPSIFESICRLGARDAEVEVAPPRPRVRVLKDMRDAASFRGFEMSYGLRFVQENDRSNYSKWSLRQLVVYNKKDRDTESSQWLFFAMPDVLREVVDQYLGSCHQQVVRNPFDIHTLLVTSALAMWRPYLAFLADEVEDHKRKIMLAPPRNEGDHSLDDDLQILKSLEDDVADAILAIEATGNTIEKIISLYDIANGIKSDDTNTRPVEGDRIISDVLTDQLKEVEMLLKQTRALHEKLRSTSHTVASFLTLANGNSLRNLAQTSFTENEQVGKLAVVTLIYLPMTVVLNFFSAAFIDTSSGNMKLIGEWWLFIAVGVPLTILTLLVWKIWSQCSFASPGSKLVQWQAVRGYISCSFGRSALDNEADIEKNAASRPGE